MTTERLDRIEAIVEANAAAMAELRATTQANAAAIGELRATTQANTAGIAELRMTVNSLVQIVEVHQRNHEVSQRNFEMIVSEIRGMRTESQRILEHLFGRQENDG